jgi:hypothetical protein
MYRPFDPPRACVRCGTQLVLDVHGQVVHAATTSLRCPGPDERSSASRPPV